MCSESAMIGYIQEGTIKDIVDKLKVLLATNTRLEEQLLREVREENPQYKSAHNRKIDNQTITVHHLFLILLYNRVVALRLLCRKWG